MTLTRRLVIACWALSFAGSVFAQDALLAPMFAPHAVLQRDRTIAIWGLARLGDRVTVTRNDSIRLLSIPHADSPMPLDAFRTPVAWRVAAPDTVRDFSGTCYYFARELQKTGPDGAHPRLGGRIRPAETRDPWMRLR
jgi:hypothetical protein